MTQQGGYLYEAGALARRVLRNVATNYSLYGVCRHSRASGVPEMRNRSSTASSSLRSMQKVEGVSWRSWAEPANVQADEWPTWTSWYYHRLKVVRRIIHGTSSGASSLR